MNKLYYGDNLTWLQKHDEFPNESVDLIYLDPPFNSNTDYNLIFSEKSGEKSEAQWRAFDDTWKWEKVASHTALLELAVIAPSVSEFIRWLSRHGDSKSTSMAAYLSMMAVRLLELHRILKSTGSIYLHCDPTASHYLKILLDVIFSRNNFRNEIVWKRATPIGGKIKSKMMPRDHDNILHYSKSKYTTYNAQYIPYSEHYINTYFKYVNEDGRRYRIQTLGDYSEKSRELFRRQGRIYRSREGKEALIQYLDESKGVLADDIWVDIIGLQHKAFQKQSSKEKLGYPTQKPELLLERIINTSSNEGDIVLDPFCGCGTAIVVANKLNRKWVGIDVTYLAINLVEKRLVDKFGKGVRGTYKVYGDPFDFKSAQELFDQDSKDKHAFELWALKLVNARPRLKDGGVDGVIGFIDENDDPKRIIVQVKGGVSLIPSIIRDLDGTVKNENAVIGLLITLHQPTKGMYEYANHAGDYKTAQREKPFPLLQIRTVNELLEGKQFDLPISKKPEKILYTEHERREFLF